MLKTEYKALDGKLSWDKLIVAKCQKQGSLSFFMVITALLKVAQKKKKAFHLCSPSAYIVRQDVRNTISFHIIKTGTSMSILSLEIIPFY